MKYAHIKGKQLLGWYSTDVHGGSMPKGCIEVDDDVWSEALKINANAYIDDKFVVHDFRTDGERLEQLANSIRAERDAKIEAVRWRIERHNDELALGIEPTEPLEPLLQYVQLLRDVPQQEGFPETVEWPEVPNERTKLD